MVNRVTRNTILPFYCLKISHSACNTSIFKLNAAKMKERFIILGLNVKQIKKKTANVLMVPKCLVWFLAWYFFNPVSKPNPTRNQNQYLTHVYINTKTNTNTSTKPDSISKPRFEIDTSNSIPILKSKPTSFAYP